MGFFGIAIGIFAHLSLLTSTTSFGVPYLTPFAPFRKGVFKDDLLASPIWKKELQPIYLKTKKKRKAPHISRGWFTN